MLVEFWATGCSMVLLAVAVRMRPVLVLTLAAALWLAHTLLLKVDL
jgi:uncharacterized membrane protein